MPRTAPLPSTMIPENLVAPENPGGSAHNSSLLAAAARSTAESRGGSASTATPLAANTHGTRPLHPRGGAREPDKAGYSAGALRLLPPAVAGPMTQARAPPSWGSKAPPSRCPRKQRRQQHQHCCSEAEQAQRSKKQEEGQRARTPAEAVRGEMYSTESQVQPQTTQVEIPETCATAPPTEKQKLKSESVSPLSLVGLFMTPCSVAHQAPLSMDLSRQEDWRSAGDLPNTGIKPRPPALQTDSLPSEPPGQPYKQKKDL